MRQLTSVDAQFLALENRRQYGHVSGLAIVDPSTAPGGEIDLADMQYLLAERLPLLPPMRWRLAEVPLGLDYGYWVDDPEFDLDFHVRELGLAPPGDDRKLAEQVARLIARPLDRSRPLWELYLIHGLPDGRVAVLTKIHHAVVDGLSGAEILGILLDPSPEGRELPDVSTDDLDAAPGDLGMLARGLLGVPRYPLRVLQALPSTLPNLEDVAVYEAIPGAKTVGRVAGRVQRALGGGSDAPTVGRRKLRKPHTSFNGRLSAHRRFVVRAALARRGQGGQERARLHGQRRGRVDVRVRGPALADRARRAAGGSARGAGAGVGAHAATRRARSATGSC